MTNDLVSNLITAQKNLNAHYVSGVGDLRAISNAFDEANSALRAELGRLQKVESVNKGMLEALKYSRRFLKPQDHDTALVDAAIRLAEGEDHANQS